VGESGHALLKRRPLPSASRYGLWIEVEMPQERPPRRESCQSLALVGSPGLVIGPSSSIRVRSPISAGSAFADELLLHF
jgi:hypothetical protein